LAGECGIDPGPRTLAELIPMGEARRRAEWARTCEILAMTYNLNRPKGSTARKGKWFLDQILRPRDAAAIPVLDDLSILETVFVQGKLPGNTS
jgi:hypothetical protein